MKLNITKHVENLNIEINYLKMKRDLVDNEYEKKDIEAEINMLTNELNKARKEDKNDKY